MRRLVDKSFVQANQRIVLQIVRFVKCLPHHPKTDRSSLSLIRTKLHNWFYHSGYLLAQVVVDFT